MKKLYVIWVMLLGLALPAWAQDPQFTQFYAAPLYQNPAFAGSAHRGRAILNYRNQWPTLPQAFVTTAASVDNYFKDYNSGAGVTVMADRSGSGRLMRLQIGGQYAYEMPLTRVWAVRAGFEFAYRQSSLDFSKLVFSDQLGSGGQNPSSQEPLASSSARSGAFDVSTGGLIYSKRYWFGISGLHLNTPNQSVAQGTDRLPIRYNITGGTNFPLGSKGLSRRYNSKEAPTSVTAAFLYKRQGDFQQADIGAYLNVEPIVFGVWYRGIPGIKNANNTLNQDAVAFLVGLKMPYYSVGYSYDLTVSSLGANTGGAHELSFSYEFDTGRYKRKHTAIPCPKF
jgi:type IX secretion system PorP/SprF family membrane protein